MDGSGRQGEQPSELQEATSHHSAQSQLARLRGKCNLHRRIALTLATLVLLPLILLVAPASHMLGRLGHPAAPGVVPCASRGKPTAITAIYVIHSYWSEQRRDFAPALCKWLKDNGGELSNVPCILFPGYWAKAATREQVWDLVARRIVGPESHAQPQGWLTRLLYRLGISGAAPLFDEQERVINPSYLGTAASHLLAVQNWTLEMSRQQVPPQERVDQHLLLFEDDAVVTRGGIEGLQHALPFLDKCYDVLALDSTDNFCASSRWVGAMRSLLLPRRWLRSPQLVPVRMSYSRNTGLVVSSKGALHLLSGLPVTREIDLWYRDLMTDHVLKTYVSCPRLIGSQGLPTVV